MTALLAFDTSTERLHIGLRVGGVTWLHESEGGARASAALIPDVLALLRGAGIGLNGLDAIAFGRGPGAFTGLRTACAAAQGLAFGAVKPVLALDTLMVVAEDARLRCGAGDVWVAMDARMGEVYAAHYRHVDGAWQTARVPALYAPEHLLANWRGERPRTVAGSAVPALESGLEGDAVETVPDARPAAEALLACASIAWAAGRAADAAEALPHYVRDRVALTSAEREGARARSAA